MPNIPNICVQLVHIQGPLKGEIQDFSESPIIIGRHPSCHLRFDKSMTAISRKHAIIERQGNKFRITDKSTNGTFVNGKRIADVYLRDGDVITFSENGPKASFLTKIDSTIPAAGAPAPGPSPSPIAPQAPPAADPFPQPAAPPPVSKPDPFVPPQPQPPVAAQPAQSTPAASVPIVQVKVPLVIQYGPTLRSYNELPVTIGKNPACDFTIDHDALVDRHAQIFFSQDQYWAKDLTGRQMLSIDNQPLNVQGPLKPDVTLSLSGQGPKFRFLGGGRLAEIEEPAPSMQTTDPDIAGKKAEPVPPQAKPVEKKGSIFKKFFK